MRVISGKFRGKKLSLFKGTHIRPTSDKIRQAVFNIIKYAVDGAYVLDLFAGTGAMGVEALSRGAKSAVFVDKDSNALSLIRKNLESLEIEKNCYVIKWDILNNLNFLRGGMHAFDLIFIDPPYCLQMAEKTIANLAKSGAAAQNATIVIEHTKTESLKNTGPFIIEDQRKYGEKFITFLKYASKNRS